jgi:hypothetical protein
MLGDASSGYTFSFARRSCPRRPSRACGSRSSLESKEGSTARVRQGLRMPAKGLCFAISVACLVARDNAEGTCDPSQLGSGFRLRPRSLSSNNLSKWPPCWRSTSTRLSCSGSCAIPFVRGALGVTRRPEKPGSSLRYSSLEGMRNIRDTVCRWSLVCRTSSSMQPAPLHTRPLGRAV